MTELWALSSGSCQSGEETSKQALSSQHRGLRWSRHGLSPGSPSPLTWPAPPQEEWVPTPTTYTRLRNQCPARSGNVT